VDYDGTLDLSSYGAQLYIETGLTATTDDGADPGVVDLSGTSDDIYFEGTQTFDDATINLTGNNDYIEEYYNLTLTFGSALTIDQSAGYAYLTSYYPSYYEGGIINDGTINASANGGSLTINPYSFVNNGQINITNGDTVYIDVSSLTNTDDNDLNAGAGITIDSSSALYLQGSFATPASDSIDNNGGKLYIDGADDNSGAILDVGTGFDFGQTNLADEGTITGGSIEDSGSGMTFSGGTLDGVSYDTATGSLDLSPDNSSLFIADGLTLTSDDGADDGAVALAGNDSQMDFEGTQTFDNATITMSGTGNDIFQYTTYTEYVDNGYISPDATLTLGSNLTLDQTAGTGFLSSAGDHDDSAVTTSTIENDGTINAEASGGTLSINPDNFVNTGGIDVSNTDTLDIAPTNFTNTGTIEVDSGSTINVNTATAGTGTFNIGASGTLILDGVMASTQSIDFLGSTGTLQLDAPGDFAGTITGFGGSDEIDIKGINFINSSQATYSGGVLTVTDGTNTAQFDLSGNYSTSTFTTSNDNSGGVIVVDPLLAGHTF